MDALLTGRDPGAGGCDRRPPSPRRPRLALANAGPHRARDVSTELRALGRRAEQRWFSWHL